LSIPVLKFVCFYFKLSVQIKSRTSLPNRLSIILAAPPQISLNKKGFRLNNLRVIEKLSFWNDLYFFCIQTNLYIAFNYSSKMHNYRQIWSFKTSFLNREKKSAKLLNEWSQMVWMNELIVLYGLLWEKMFKLKLLKG
jgi:hypothetical protein